MAITKTPGTYDGAWSPKRKLPAVVKLPAKTPLQQTIEKTWCQMIWKKLGSFFSSLCCFWPFRRKAEKITDKNIFDKYDALLKKQKIQEVKAAKSEIKKKGTLTDHIAAVKEGIQAYLTDRLDAVKLKSEIEEKGIQAYLTDHLDAIVAKIYVEDSDIDKKKDFLSRLPLYPFAHLKADDLPKAAQALITPINENHRFFSDECSKLKKVIIAYLYSLDSENQKSQLIELCPNAKYFLKLDAEYVFDQAVLNWINKQQGKLPYPDYAKQEAQAIIQGKFLVDKDLLRLAHKFWPEYSNNEHRDQIFEMALELFDVGDTDEESFKKLLQVIDDCLHSAFCNDFIREHKENLEFKQKISEERKAYNIECEKWDAGVLPNRPIEPEGKVLSNKEFLRKFKDRLKQPLLPPSSANLEALAQHLAAH